ncbi:MAG: carbohydrate ABC transporter permease [Bacilli bacterium]
MKPKKLSLTLIHCFLIVCSLLAIFPFVWMIIGATNTHVDIISGKFIPGTNLINNFKQLFTETEILSAFQSSLIISSIGVFLMVLVSSLAAYGFTFFATKTTKKIYSIFLLSMMIPFSALMIPLFRLSSSLGILDTYSGLILTTTLNIFLIFFFSQGFKAMPYTLIEAARMDGEKELLIFFKIVFPVMKTTFAAGTIFAFIGSWNNYLWPIIFLQSSSKYTLPLFLSNLANGYVIDYALVMSAIIISTLPVLLVFVLLQKHFVNGMMGSIK